MSWFNHPGIKTGNGYAQNEVITPICPMVFRNADGTKIRKPRPAPVTQTPVKVKPRGRYVTVKGFARWIEE